MDCGPTALLRLPARRRLARAGFAFFLCAGMGCALGHANLDRAVMTDQGSAARNQHVEECYLVHCPDVLDIVVRGRADATGRRAVQPDGRIHVCPGVRVLVEGNSVRECERLVAERLGVRIESVRIRVADYHSQQIYLFGQVHGSQRAVAYQGPETVLDLLRRAGGLTPGAATNAVYVVRPGIADATRPTVFHIDLREVAKEADARGNIRVQAFDEIHIGETWPSSLTKCVPFLLRPLYEACWGLRPAGTLAR